MVLNVVVRILSSSVDVVVQMLILPEQLVQVKLLYGISTNCSPEDGAQVVGGAAGGDLCLLHGRLVWLCCCL